MRVFLLVTLFLFGSTAAAQEESSIFTVPRVPVYAEADTAAAAQAEAQSQGRRVAMDLLLRRLTAEADWQFLPRLAAAIEEEPEEMGGVLVPMADDDAAPAEDQAPADSLPSGEGMVDTPPYGGMVENDPFGASLKQPVALDPDMLPQIEQSFAVFDEKSSRNTYRANITYRFKPEAVRRLLREARLPFSEAQSREALVLPVLETGNGLYLWEAKNPWARAWLARPLENELTPLVLPRGDARDIRLVSVEEAFEFDGEALKMLADRYDVPQVIVALGQLEEEDGNFRLTVQLIDGYLEGRSSGRREVTRETSADLYDTEGGFGAEGLGAVVSEGQGSTLAQTFFRGPGTDFPALAQRAVESTVTTYAADWKDRTLVDESAVRTFALTAWFEGLDQWADIRTALERTPLVKAMEPGVFNKENAVLDVTAIGDPAQFELAMQQDNLTVWPAAQGGWNVAEAALAESLREGEEPVVTDLEERVRRERQLQRELRGRDDGSRSFGGITEGPLDARSGVPGERGTIDRSPAQVPELPDDLFGEEAGEDGTGRDTILERERGEDEPDSIDDILLRQ